MSRSSAGFGKRSGIGDRAAIDSHGRIIVVGTSIPSVGGRNFRVLRFLPDGDLDTSFAGDGNTPFVESAGDFEKSLFARFKNANGPRPDLIFRNGFQ